MTGWIIGAFIGGVIAGAAILELTMRHHENRQEMRRAAEVLRLEREVRGLGRLLHD
jgi:hypothetical protein